MEVMNPTTRQRCYKMGSVFQSDHKWNTSLFCFLGFTLMFACVGLCGHQGSHSHYSRSNSYGFRFQIRQTGSPLWMTLSADLDVELCCRVTWGRGPCSWDWFIYADVAYAQSPELQALLPANSWCLIQITSSYEEPICQLSLRLLIRYLLPKILCHGLRISEVHLVSSERWEGLGWESQALHYFPIQASVFFLESHTFGFASGQCGLYTATATTIIATIYLVKWLSF